MTEQSTAWNKMSVLKNIIFFLCVSVAVSLDKHSFYGVLKHSALTK
jgi:hypothetical protein